MNITCLIDVIVQVMSMVSCNVPSIQLQWNLRLKDTSGTIQIQLFCSLLRGCPLLGDSQCIETIGRVILGSWAMSFIETSNTQCPFLRGSTIGGSTVLPSEMLASDSKSSYKTCFNYLQHKSWPFGALNNFMVPHVAQSNLIQQFYHN